MSAVMGKARYLRSSRQEWGQGHVSSDGRSVVVPPLVWHHCCCIIVVRWTCECMSTHAHTDITAYLHMQVAGVVG